MAGVRHDGSRGQSAVTRDASRSGGARAGGKKLVAGWKPAPPRTRPPARPPPRSSRGVGPVPRRQRHRGPLAAARVARTKPIRPDATTSWLKVYAHKLA